MHTKHAKQFEHHHAFADEKRTLEKRTLAVIIITFVTMAAEILFGWLSNSMALLADGWHMGTHAFALGISLSAYVAARKLAFDSRFNFGTWKIEILGAYTSAIVLGIVALTMVFASVERLIHPLHIRYNEALLVAGLGLVVNLVCALVLTADPAARHSHHDHHDKKKNDGDHHGHDEHHHHHHAKNDLNLKAAYVHVLADAMTSVLAIIALCAAKYYGTVWLDPCMGLLGAALIGRWSVSLIRESSKILLEREADPSLISAIRSAVESDNDSHVVDLHVWRVADKSYACVVSVLAHNAVPVEEYKRRLGAVPGLAHVTVEANRCCGDSPGNADER